MKRGLLMTLVVVVALDAAPAPAEEDAYGERRQRMVQEIAVHALSAGNLSGRPVFDERVMAAMARVPRHAFVPEDRRESAYDNRPLPIGHGQTISQPYIVALMTDLLELEADHVALEVGTGSGYQAAILAELVSRVYSIEIIEPLAREAAARLNRLGFDKVATRHGDGYYGWEAYAPFDVIIVTAAAGHVPPPLIAQLKPGGRMVIPVGGSFLTQYLMMVEKDSQGRVTNRQILPVRFVPLKGGP